jgi:hypothetical protein
VERIGDGACSRSRSRPRCPVGPPFLGRKASLSLRAAPLAEHHRAGALRYRRGLLRRIQLPSVLGPCDQRSRRRSLPAGDRIGGGAHGWRVRRPRSLRHASRAAQPAARAARRVLGALHSRASFGRHDDARHDHFAGAHVAARPVRPGGPAAGLRSDARRTARTGPRRSPRDPCRFGDRVRARARGAAGGDARRALQAHRSAQRHTSAAPLAGAHRPRITRHAQAVRRRSRAVCAGRGRDRRHRPRARIHRGDHLQLPSTARPVAPPTLSPSA